MKNGGNVCDVIDDVRIIVIVVVAIVTSAVASGVV